MPVEEPGVLGGKGPGRAKPDPWVSGPRQVLGMQWVPDGLCPPPGGHVLLGESRDSRGGQGRTQSCRFSVTENKWEEGSKKASCKR